MARQLEATEGPKGLNSSIDVETERIVHIFMHIYMCIKIMYEYMYTLPCCFFCFVFARPDALRFQRLSTGQAWLDSHENRKACEDLWTCFTWEGFLDDLENCWYM